MAFKVVAVKSWVNDDAFDVFHDDILPKINTLVYQWYSDILTQLNVLVNP